MSPPSLTLADLSGQLLAGRYRLEACLASGLLSAVFRATELEPLDEAAGLLLQLRRPFDAPEGAPPVELHDHLLLGGGFTADLMLAVDVEAASLATGDAAAAWLVAQTDATLRAADGESTAPGLPVPMAAETFDPGLLDAADHDELASAFDDGEPDTGLGLDDQSDNTLAGVDTDDFGDLGENTDLTDPGARNETTDTAAEMPVIVIDRPSEP